MRICGFLSYSNEFPSVKRCVCRCTHRHAHTRRPRPGVRVRVRVRPVVCHGQPSFREVKVSGERETSVTRECCVPTLVVGPGTDGDGRGGAGRGECPRSNRHSPTLPPRPSSLLPAPSHSTRVSLVCVGGARGGGNGRGRREDSDDKIITNRHTHTPSARAVPGEYHPCGGRDSWKRSRTEGGVARWRV